MRSRGRLSGGSISIASPTSNLSPKSPLSPESKAKAMYGNFSPVHTRRRTQSEDVSKVLPDFAVFNIAHKCPKITSSLESEIHDIDGELLDLLQVESELNMLLTHCIDHQKKIIGEIHFLETGDYRSEDISKRLMPTYELRNLDNIAPSTSAAEAEEDASVDATLLNEEDDYESSCPTVNMPGKFWKFIKDYQGSLDENFLYDYYTQVLSPLFTDDVGKSSVRNGRIVPYISNDKSKTSMASPLASPTHRKALKRQSSVGKSMEKPLKMPKTADEGIDSLLAETIQAWSSEEKTKFPWMQNGYSEASACSGAESLSNGCDQMNNEVEEKFNRKELDGSDKFVDRFDKSLLGIEYKNLKDTVINVINASQCGFPKEVERDALKKEFWPEHCSGGVNGANGSRVVAHFEAFKRTLMNFVKGAIESNFPVDHNVNCANSDVQFNRQDENGLVMLPCKSEELEMEEEKSEPVEIGQDLDQVSAALKKAQEDLQDRNESCRYITVAVWHRILAEYLRKKLESDLSDATKELNAVREKYYRDYPPKKPTNDKEREECAAALRKYNNVLKSYYEK